MSTDQGRRTNDAVIGAEWLHRAVDEHAIVAVTDPSGKITYANARFSAISGYSREELLGQDHRILNSGKHSKQFFVDMWRTISRGDVWRGEVCNRAKDGSLYWVNTTILPIRDSDGVITQHVAIRNDITNQKDYELTVRHLKATLDVVADGIFMFDPHTLQFFYCNDGAVAQVGYTNDELMRMTPLNIKPEFDERRFRRTIKPLIQTPGSTICFETIHRHKNGQDVPVEVVLQYVAAAHQPARFVAIARDITERLANREQLVLAKEAAEQASLAKSQFLANMSHELRTPLHGVIGMSELLIGTELDGAQRELADACLSSGRMLLSLVSDVLDLSKIEADKLELEAHGFELGTLVKDAVGLMSSAIQTKGVELALNIATDAQCNVIGDPTRLKQVLINLLGNAAKFTDSGEIVVRASVRWTGPDRAKFLFTVRDTGAGIPADRLEGLFTPFTQADASTTRNFGGTGLGLAICKSIVEMMGGEIGVESREGAGSTFWFTVDLALADQSRQVGSLSLLRDIRILVADPSSTNTRSLREVLSSWNLRLQTAGDVDEVRTHLKQAGDCGAPIQVLLIDEELYLQDQPFFDNELRLRGGQLHMLLMTGFGSHFEPPSGCAHISKPVKSSLLFDALVSALDKDVQSRGTKLPVRASHLERVARADARILLVEDNTTNQKYACEVLRRAGYSCDLASNGRQAVDAVIAKPYDLVLMDCQMPEMDGFEATRRIRQLEEEGRLPGSLRIIALTANALKGDAEACLEAGMDHYVSKPFEPATLIGHVHTQLNTSHGADHEKVDQSVATALPNEPFNRDRLLQRCMGDLEFVTGMLDSFAAEIPECLVNLRHALTDGDADAARRFAHSVKGAAGMITAETVQSIAAEIEWLSREGELAQARTHLRVLREEVEHCLTFIESDRPSQALPARSPDSSDNVGADS